MRVKFLTFILVLSLVGLIGITNESYAKVSPATTELKNADSDNGGMLDVWERANKLDPKNPNDAQVDSDKDGYSNLCEYLHKTDPNDAESKPSSNITINVPSDVKTIQEAINASIDGDTIAVSKGKYQGNINFKGKSITLISTDSDNPNAVAKTIIEGTESGSVITIDRNSVLRGFTITSKNLDCRGVYIKNASPKIENCTIIDNQTIGRGGGIYISTTSSSPRITNCIITGNSDNNGTGQSAQISGGTPEVSQSYIEGQGLVDNTTKTPSPADEKLTEEPTVPTPEIHPAGKHPTAFPKGPGGINPNTITPTPQTPTPEIIPTEPTTPTTPDEPELPVIQNVNKVGRTQWIKEGNIAHTSLILNQTSANNMTAMQEANISCSLSVSFQPPQFESKDSYNTVQISGLDIWNGTAGSPILPFKPMRILIPYGQKVVGVKVISGASQEISGEYILKPAQKQVPIDQIEQAQPTPPNPAIYSSDSPYPYVPCGDAFLQGKSGYAILILNLFPVEYHPLSRKLFYYPNMSVEVETVPLEATSSTMSATEGVSSFAPDPQVKNEISSMVDNPEMLQTYETGAGAKQLITETLGSDSQYVIITTNALRNAGTSPYKLDDLIADKIARGVTATIVTVENEISSYPDTRPDGGHDVQTRIRNFIIDYYTHHGTRYVLLAGNKDNIPRRMFWVDSLMGDQTDMPVDMYYGCLDGTFDYNANGVYGEPCDGKTGGDVDLDAEVYIGRAPVVSGEEISNFVRKTLTYEHSTGYYLHYVYMLGEQLGFGEPSEYATESMEQIRLGSNADGYTTMGFKNSNFETHTLYEDINDCPPNWYYPPGWDRSKLIDIMNSGVHILNHLGHANYIYDMKLYSPNTLGYHPSDLSSLTNTDYFFVYSQGCMSGGFDDPVDPDYNPNGDRCFAEAITTMDKGAFAVVMNAREGWGAWNSTDSASQRYNRHFWDAFLGEGITNLGRMNQDSKEDNINKINDQYMRWCYYELNLFGDPEITINITNSKRWYVDDSVTTSGDGKSWEHAFKYLQDALAVASSGDYICVARGTYKPDQGNSIILGDRTATFQLKNGVAIKGGYAGLDYIELGAPDPDAHDIANYETILSGDMYGNDGNPPNFAYYNDNSYHVVTGSGTNASAIIDGFIIESGFGNDIVSNPTPDEPWQTIGGGGMRNVLGSPVVKNCTFRYNKADRTGGAIANISSSPEITNCIFIGNNVKRAVGTGGDGSAIYNYNSQSQVKNCAFTDNYSLFWGGAIDNESNSVSEITNCIFSNNTSWYGGAIANGEGSSMTITNCVFAGNTASLDGGGLSNWHSSVVVTNCTFYQNQAGYRGGGVFNLGGEDYSSATLTNCILWDNIDNYSGNDEVKSAFGTNPVDISYCDIKGSGGSGPSGPNPNWDIYFGIDGGGNIDADPLFVDPSNPLDNGLRLSQDSPCIDKANNTAAPLTDILGIERFGTADMGAYEFELDRWITYGGPAGDEFYFPYGIYYDSASGYIYVADSENNRIVKTKINGDGWTPCYGPNGPNPGVDNFSYPCGIYYDNSTGYIYVIDTANHRIVKTKINGDGWTPCYGPNGPNPGVDNFSSPSGIYYDSASGYIYVADYQRIVKTKINGDGWTTYGSGGSGKGQFNFPTTIYYASEYIYVADGGNDRIVKTKIDGTGWTTLEGFSGPDGIYYDSASEYIYVTEYWNNRIVKTKINGDGWTTYGTKGSGEGQFWMPFCIYYDNITGYIYVADTANHRIVKTYPPW